MEEEKIPTNYVLFIEKELYYDYFGITNKFLAGFLGNIYNRNEQKNPTIKVYTDVSAAAKKLYINMHLVGINHGTIHN